MKKLEALNELYAALNFENPDIINDIDNNYLTGNFTRSGRPVFWYFDGDYNKAIYIDSGEFLTGEEIEKELC